MGPYMYTHKKKQSNSCKSIAVRTDQAQKSRHATPAIEDNRSKMGLPNDIVQFANRYTSLETCLQINRNSKGPIITINEDATRPAVNSFNTLTGTKPVKPTDAGHRFIQGQIVQRALPINKDAYYGANRQQIQQTDGGAPREEASIAIFTNLEYMTNVVKPFLENRKDLIMAYTEENWEKISQQLNMLEHWWQWAKKEQSCQVFSLGASNKSIAPLINLADTLPDMHSIPEIAGGYKSDKTIRGGINELQRTLANLGGNEVLKTGTPQEEGLNVPVIDHQTFFSSKKIPEALKRLVRDIHHFWKLDLVLDTRSQQEKTAKAKTPDNAGALRTWHMNEFHSLPDIGENPDLSHPLHAHYQQYSQAGNVHEAEAPIGYAEYTGIDADQNKIILNYTNGHIFITAIHYQFWYDIPERQPAGISGKLSESRLQKPPNAEENQIRSPWVRVKMP